MYFGGDYNPEQWPASVWADDFALMRQASVNLVTVGVFSWSRLQPTPDTFDFGWLDTVLDGLHEAGIGVCLATPTASPPPWFTRRYPDSMPVTRDGVRLTHGSRDTYCVNAPAYRAASVRIASELATRYGTHPALQLWHVHNEYGTWCFCAHCAVEFRAWLGTRYSTVEALNDAWSTDFWSQRYAGWDEIEPPRATQYLRNPAQELDYRRFMSDSLLRGYLEQKTVLSGRVPVTTNFVLGDWVPVDHARWSAHVDLVAIDDYPPDLAGRAFSADRARGWARAAGHPDGRWLLMEHAPGYTHTSSGMRRSADSLSTVASVYLDRGATGIMYFQWRASRGGAEQWHPALVGYSSAVFSEAVDLGASLASRTPAVVSADVAVVYDEESMWAWQSPHLPTRVDYTSLVQSWHAALSASASSSDGRPVDVIPVGASLEGYRLVVVPALYLMSAAAHEWLRTFTGHLVITAGTGLVDEHARTTPDSLADLIGATIAERDFSPWLDTVVPTAAGPHPNVTYLPSLDVVPLDGLW